MKGRFLALWAVAVLAAGASFVAHLTLRFETVRLGYEVGAAHRQQARLRDSHRLLSLEAATLSQADRVESIARGTLGMDMPEADRVVAIGAKRKHITLSGRAQ